MALSSIPAIMTVLRVFRRWLSMDSPENTRVLMVGENLAVTFCPDCRGALLTAIERYESEVTASYARFQTAREFQELVEEFEKDLDANVTVESLVKFE